jgi:DNA-binding response OmpR family regulator
MKDEDFILYVEDDRDNRDLLQFMFENAGYQLKTCATGEEALQVARRNGIAAYILDNWLGDMSGVQLCQEIRTFDRKTPIVFFSGVSYSKDRKEGLTAGAQSYLVKPDDLDKIIETVEQLTS